MRYIAAIEKDCPLCGTPIRVVVEEIPVTSIYSEAPPYDTRVPVVEEKCPNAACGGSLAALGRKPW